MIMLLVEVGVVSGWVEEDLRVGERWAGPSPCCPCLRETLDRDHNPGTGAQLHRTTREQGMQRRDRAPRKRLHRTSSHLKDCPCQMRT